MAMNRFTNPDIRPLPVPLVRLLYAIAQDGADEELGGPHDDLWAWLLRDGSDIADRAREMIQSGIVDVRPDDIEQEAWGRLEQAAGVIATRDIGGRISVQPFQDDEDLMSAWQALALEVEPTEPGSPVTRTPESDENPT
jgi:hypothetical protein